VHNKFLKESGYISGKSVSTDGTKIKAYASRASIPLKLPDKKLEQAKKEIECYFTRLHENDTIENEQAEMLETGDELKKQIAELQARVETLKSQKILLETLERESMAPFETEAKIMKTKDVFFYFHIMYGPQ
jgi:PP-loop superfamily ATP-utilizing enzyme